MKPPIIFVAFANERENNNRYLRGLPMEQSGIRNALLSAARAEKVELIELPNATLSEIINFFTDPRFQGRIKGFHFGGHSNSYSLLFEQQAGGTTNQVADAGTFAKFLGDQKSLEFVFLNGCENGAQVDALLKNGIPTVIATTSVIQDAIATQFAIRFYRSIGSYRTVTQSYQDTVSEIQTGMGTSSNLRKVYWEDLPESEVPTAMPWKLHPEMGSSWKLMPPVASNIPFKLGPFAHLSVNRDRQRDEFELSFSKALGKPVRKPMIYLIHGMPEDQHNSLVTRFSIELIGRNEYIRPTEISNFPTNKDQIANLQFLLKKRIIDAFPHLAKTGKDAHNLSSHDIIKQTPFNGLKHVIIEHKIFGENWTSSTEDLLKWYIGEYWNVEMADTTLPNVSIFISIIYSEDQIQGGFLKSIFSSKFYKSKIIDILNNIASDYSQHCVVLTELEKIKKAHLENWVLSSNLTAVPEMLQLATRLFESGDVLQKYISMASVETELKKTIDNLSLKYG